MMRHMPLSAASDLLPLVGSLVLVAALLYGCYRLSRYLTKRATGIVNSSNIRILERVAIAQDKGLLIAEICGKCYLIGFSNKRVEILKELDPSLLRRGEPPSAPHFMDILNTALKGRWDLTGHDKKDNIGRR